MKFGRLLSLIFLFCFVGNCLAKSSSRENVHKTKHAVCKVAQKSKHNKQNHHARPHHKHGARPPQSSIVVDMDTGKVIHEHNSHHLSSPASLTKAMTAYVVFSALKKGSLKMHDRIIISKHANSMEPSRLNIKTGESISVATAIRALVIKSANNVACAIAEKVSGSEEKFAHMMTSMAHKIGMKSTTFKNASGLYHPQQRTTAADMARLAIALKKHFPEYYGIFSETSFVFNGNIINTHNRVMVSYEGAHGLKTGYIKHSNYNLITTANKCNKNLVGVIIGAKTSKGRDSQMMALLDRCFLFTNGGRRIASR